LKQLAWNPKYSARKVILSEQNFAIYVMLSVLRWCFIRINKQNWQLIRIWSVLCLVYIKRNKSCQEYK
jgi:hypothetical protein